MAKRSKSFFIVFIVLASGLSPAFAATKAPQPVNLRGFSEFVAKTMAEWKVPGMAVAIVKDGKVVFAEGFGFRDVERGLKVTPHTIFPIGSCSKAFTAADDGDPGRRREGRLGRAREDLSPRFPAPGRVRGRAHDVRATCSPTVRACRVTT